jgi:hypothetical protein
MGGLAVEEFYVHVDLYNREWLFFLLDIPAESAIGLVCAWNYDVQFTVSANFVHASAVSFV